jgi:hypothetical protein
MLLHHAEIILILWDELNKSNTLGLFLVPWSFTLLLPGQLEKQLIGKFRHNKLGIAGSIPCFFLLRVSCPMATHTHFYFSIPQVAEEPDPTRECAEWFNVLWDWVAKLA